MNVRSHFRNGFYMSISFNQQTKVKAAQTDKVVKPFFFATVSEPRVKK